MNWHALDGAILGPALLAGLLVLLTHVPLGMEVLRRGIVFIDLAVAQIAGLGVIVAHAAGVAEHAWAVQGAAVSAALLGAALLTWTERRAGSQQEAFIGVLFVLASSVGILLLASNPHGSEYLKDLLVGQILWVDGKQIAALAGVSALVLLWMNLASAGKLGRFGFYAGFAVAVTASVQLVGVYLVFTTLIVPALATARWSGRRRYALAFGVGIVGYALGLALSALFDLPSGAVVVCTMAACGLALRSAAASPGMPRQPAHASSGFLPSRE